MPEAYSDEIELLTYAQAVALLPDGDEIHTFVNPAPDVLIGADWPRKKILALLRETDRREVTGPEAQAMNHGLAAFRKDVGPVFIATRPAEAVARAVTPGHGEHIVTDLNAHRRHGCPTCLQAVTPPATRPGGC